MAPDRSQKLYLDLLAKSLAGELYLENELRLRYLQSCLDGRERFDQSIYLHVETARPELWQHFQQLVAEGRIGSS